MHPYHRTHSIVLKEHSHPSWYLWPSCQRNQRQNSIRSIQRIKLILPISVVFHSQERWKISFPHTWFTAIKSSVHQGCIGTPNPQNLCQVIWWLQMLWDVQSLCRIWSMCPWWEIKRPHHFPNTTGHTPSNLNSHGLHQIFYGDVTFILRDKIPHVTMPYIDDIPVKGPLTHYELPIGKYETISENSNICQFMWKHLLNVNWVIHRMCKAGGTFLGNKTNLWLPEVIVGHKCTYEGCLPDESHVQKIKNWPPCKNLTDVQGFLGMAGTVHIFTRNFTIHAHPLI